MIKESQLFKLIIDRELENKIRFLCTKSPNLEWSGVLFYDVIGGTFDKDLVLKAVDLLPMNQGSGAETSYIETPDIIEYQMEKDLLNCKKGLIHSHHTMQTFFSGTDMSTLEKEGSETVHFLSLIINNAGIYNAAFTRKIKRKMNIVEEITTFGNKTSEVKKKKEDVVVSYINAEISIEKEESPYEDLWKGLIEKTKAQKDKELKERQLLEESIKNLPLNQKNFNVKNYLPNNSTFQYNLFDNIPQNKQPLKENYNIILGKIITLNLLFNDKGTTLKALSLYYFKQIKSRFDDEDYELIISSFIETVLDSCSEEYEVVCKKLIEIIDKELSSISEYSEYIELIKLNLSLWIQQEN